VISRIGKGESSSRSSTGATGQIAHPEGLKALQGHEVGVVTGGHQERVIQTSAHSQAKCVALEIAKVVEA